MSWMDDAGAPWLLLLLVCFLLLALVVVASLSLLRRPPRADDKPADLRILDQDLASGRISPQEYQKRRAEQVSRSHAA